MTIRERAEDLGVKVLIIFGLIFVLLANYLGLMEANE